MKTLAFAISTLAALLLLSAPAACSGDVPDILQFGSRLETHSDADSPDDYIYNSLSLTKHLEDKVIANVFYVNKFNLETNNSGGHSAGINLISTLCPRSFGLLNYTYTLNEADSTRAFRVDRDRFRAGYFRKLHQSRGGTRVTASFVFNTQTDLSESRTLDAGLAWHRPFTPHWASDTEYKYTRSFGAVDGHVFNQWGLKLTFKASKRTDYDLGYLFVDKVFDVPGSNLEPYDDNILRAGVTHRIK